jgi:hypothetical protein
MEIIRRRRGAEFPLDLNNGVYIIGDEVKQAPIRIDKAIVYDGFDRADGQLGVAPTGQSWENIFGNLVINGGHVVNPNGTSNARSVIQTGVSNCRISLSVPVIRPGTRIAFRVTDAQNYFTFQMESGHFRLYRFVSGTATLIGNNNAYAPQDGDVMQVVLNGDSIKCFVNDNLVFDVIDTFNVGATKHGIAINSSEAKVDEFIVIGVV